MRRMGIVVAAVVFVLALPMAAAAGGFDQYGYNDSAHVFVGTGSSWCQGKLGWDQTTCDAYMGVYANDKLVMKWNAAWDACNAAGNDNASACAGAWLLNEWNGKAPGGSGQVWHYKIIWVGSAGASSPYWLDGGYSIWGNYEVIMDQGFDPNVGPGHMWFAHATPNAL
jgi:hypothetical protein